MFVRTILPLIAAISSLNANEAPHAACAQENRSLEKALAAFVAVLFAFLQKLFGFHLLAECSRVSPLTGAALLRADASSIFAGFQPSMQSGKALPRSIVNVIGHRVPFGASVPLPPRHRG